MNIYKRIMDIVLLSLLLIIPIVFAIYIFNILSSKTMIISSGISNTDKAKLSLAACVFLESIAIFLYVILVKSIKNDNRSDLILYKLIYHMKNNKIKTIVFFAFSILCFFLILLYFIQTKLLFLPSRSDNSEYYILNQVSDFEKIQISNVEGLTYTGFLHHSNKEFPSLLVYFGGNSQNSASTMEHWNDKEIWKYIEDYDVLMIDYPGYGTSEGLPSEQSIFKMADSVMEYIISDKNYNIQDVVLMGFSLGTGVANYAAANYKISKILLIAPYDKMLTIYNQNINIFHGPLKKLIKHPFESDKYAETITSKVLIIASSADEVIPIDSSKTLDTHYNDSIFVTLNNYHHNDILSQNETWNIIKDFLNK